MSADRKNFLVKIRGGVEVDSYGKKAGKGALIAEEISNTIGTSQDQYLFQAVGFCPEQSAKTRGIGYQEECSPTLRANATPSVAITFEPGIASREGGHIYEGVSGTLRAKAGDNQMAIAYGVDMYNQDLHQEVEPTLGVNCGISTGRNGVVLAYGVENHPNDSRVKIDDSGTCQTLTSRMGTGGGNVPLVMFSKHRRAKFQGDFETWGESQTTNTLNVFDSGDVRATDIVVCETYHCNTEIDKAPPLKARDWKDPLVIAIDRSTFNQGENAKYDISVSGGGTAYTIVARGPGAVAYPRNYNDRCKNG